MKHFFSTIILLLGVCILHTNAQVTITQSNFPRSANFIDTIVNVPVNNVILPSEGANQVWDYSNLVSSSITTIENNDATGSTVFPGALNSYTNDLLFQGMVIPSVTYRAVDALGWYSMGRTNTDITYPLTAITGSSADSLRFIGGDYPHTGRINWLEFPTTYSSQWTNTRKEYVPFELSVAAFGLNKTPGSRLDMTTHDREVVGYGTLIMPRDEDSTTVPMDVLLIKITATRTDSFFLAGAPAPGALISAFQVVQGGTTTNTYYRFYRPDFGKPILGINLSTTGQISSVSYRRGADGSLVSVNDVALTPVQAFPNPITAGQMLTISAESTSDFERISFFDINGRLITNKIITTNSNTQIQVKVPSSLSNGLYFYTIRNREGTLVGNGKLLVK